MFELKKNLNKTFSQMKTASVLMIALAVSPAIYADVTFYRYVDKNGQQVITQTLPAEMAKRGYQVVNARGDVLRDVKPALSAEAYAKLKADQEAAARQAEADKKLLIRFRTLTEISVAKERRINDIKYNQTMVKARLDHEVKELARLTKDAANRERQQLDVGEALKESIEAARREVTSLRAQIKDYDDQLIDIDREFDLYEERFKFLAERRTK